MRLLNLYLIGKNMAAFAGVRGKTFSFSLVIS